MTSPNVYDGEHFAREDPKNIPESVRRAVLDRDNHQCQSCGTGGENRLQLHHQVLRSQGGRHTTTNLVTVCVNCHRDIHAHVLRLDYVEWRPGHFAFFRRWR